MTETEYVDEPISLTCSINVAGHTIPKKMIWNKQTHTIVVVGRQWDEEEGRHIMIETGDGTHLEIELSRADLIWRIKKIWRSPIVA